MATDNQNRNRQFNPRSFLPSLAGVSGISLGLRNVIQGIIDNLQGVMLDPDPSDQVTGVTVTKNNLGNNVSWNRALKAYRYQCFRNSSGDITTATLLRELPGNSNTSFFDPNDQTSATRYYWIRGLNAKGEPGPFSAMVSSTNFRTDPSGTAMGVDAIASGSNSTALGYNAQATAINATAMGVSAIAAGSGGTALGHSVQSGSGINNTAVGAESVTGSGANCTAVGKSAATGNGAQNTVVGASAGVTSSIAQNTVVGYNATVTAGGGNCTVVGRSATSGNTSGTAIGASADSGGGTSNVAVGTSSIISGTGGSNVLIGASTSVAANGASNTIVGASASVTTGSDNVVIGKSASSGAGSNNVLVGQSTSITGSISQNTIVGDGASVTAGGGNCTVVGRSATAGNTSQTVVGQGTSGGSGTANVIVGDSSTISTSGTANVVVGQGSVITASVSNCSVVGQGCAVSGERCTAVGQGITITHNDVIAIGQSVSSTASSQVIIGSSSSVFTDIWLGRGPTHTGAAQSTNVHATNGTGTDAAGDHMVLYPGLGTGNAATGNFDVMTASAGSSGSTLQTAKLVMRIKAGGTVIYSGDGNVPTDSAWTGTGLLMVGPKAGTTSGASANSGAIFFENTGANCSIGEFALISGSYLAIAASKQGTGTYLPISFFTSQTQQWLIGTNGGFYDPSATSGDKGVGTINVSTNIYKNNTAYTNPDYVFEHYYTGAIEKFIQNEGAKDYCGLKSLEETESEIRESLRLPHMKPRTGDTVGLFDGGENLQISVEELYLHLFRMNDRIKRLEGR